MLGLYLIPYFYNAKSKPGLPFSDFKKKKFDMLDQVLCSDVTFTLNLEAF